MSVIGRIVFNGVDVTPTRWQTFKHNARVMLCRALWHRPYPLGGECLICIARNLRRHARKMYT